MVTAHQTLVYIDLQEREACEVPADYREAITAFEGDDVER
jgi:acyl-CoA thioesterase FadM